MESIHTMLSLLIILICLIKLSDSQSIVKNLPGFHGDLPFSLETGYVGVGEDNAIQVFYYFVESERDPLHDPFLFYLTGGPGTSGLYPFLFQIGPVSVNLEISSWDNITLELNPYSWSKAANILFVDLPVGTGFSYATTYEASISSDYVVALHSHQFLVKWLVNHPKFLSNPLYITGISYMGIVAPLVTLETYMGNERGDQPQLNIKGCMIVSPLTDKFIDFNARIKFAHRLALISDEIYESTKKTCQGNYIYNDPANNQCSYNLQRVDECTSRLNIGNILDPLCDDDNPDPSCPDNADKYINTYGNNKDVQQALHVREGTVPTFEKTNSTIHYYLKKQDTTCYSYDIFSSIIHHKNLTSRNCRVLILSGDHDMTFPYVGAEQWITSLNLPIESPWKPWFVNNQVAGYQMKYASNGYSLTYGTVKGAGHAIALYKPEETLVNLNKWLASDTFVSDF